jgi:glycerol-3-phosphate dehydrogenase (NAD(P)+)
MDIIILGAGAWGTALAISAANNAAAAHHVTLWSRDVAHAALLQSQRSNAKYLPQVSFPESLHVISGDFKALVQTADVVIIATPMSGLRGMLLQLAGVTCPVAWLCKGFEAAENGKVGLLGHEIYAQIAANQAKTAQNTLTTGLKTGILSGPSFALEVAKGQPTALVAASEQPEVRDALTQAFHSPALRVYGSDDVAGVEVGGAVKNVLAIATGLCDGLQLGLNARAALITRGLVLTATGDLSRNRKVGLLLAQGKTLSEAVASLGHVAEGVYCARTVSQRALSLGVDMPITQCVVKVLDGTLSAKLAVGLLMGREATEKL